MRSSLKDKISAFGAIALFVSMFFMAIGVVLLVSVISAVVLKLCWNTGVIVLLSNYVNPITSFMTAFLISLSFATLRDNHLTSIKTLYEEFTDGVSEDDKKKKVIAIIASIIIAVAIFVFDVFVFSYTYDVVLPTIFKFNIPELDDVQLLAVYWFLNMIFRDRSSSSSSKKKEK